MFTIEMVDLDWDDRDRPKVVRSVDSPGPLVGDAVAAAKSLLDRERIAYNAFQIRDIHGRIVFQSWQKPTLAYVPPGGRKPVKISK